MSDFKVGDKVRANAVFAESNQRYEAYNGDKRNDFTQRLLDGESMVVVRVDAPDSTLPFPVGAQFVEGAQYDDGIADHMAFNPEELDHI